MKKYSLVVFDFDGTLVDTVGDIAHYANAALAEKGYTAGHPVERVKNAIGMGVHELLKILEPSLAEAPQTLEAAVERFKTMYRAKPVLSTRPFPGVVETLTGALAKVPKAIVTNKPQDITHQILSELKMATFFDAVIGMHAGYPPKPDPTSMDHLIQKMDHPKNSTAYIGDSRVDSETCRNAGIDFVWMDYGYDQVSPENYRHRFSHAADWAKLIV